MVLPGNCLHELTWVEGRETFYKKFSEGAPRSREGTRGEKETGRNCRKTAWGYFLCPAIWCGSTPHEETGWKPPQGYVKPRWQLAGAFSDSAQSSASSGSFFLGSHSNWASILIVPPKLLSWRSQMASVFAKCIAQMSVLILLQFQHR